MAAIDQLIKDFEAREASAREANIKRRGQVESIFDEIITRYGPEGSFGRGYEAQLGLQKVQDVGRAESGDISRGMYGIRNRGAEWEATTGAEKRLRLEDIKMERLSQAQTGKAGFLEGINEPYPDYGSLLAASQAAGSTGGGDGGGGGYIPTGGGSAPNESFDERMARLFGGRGSTARGEGITTVYGSAGPPGGGGGTNVGMSLYESGLGAPIMKPTGNYAMLQLAINPGNPYLSDSQKSIAQAQKNRIAPAKYYDPNIARA